jgi:hypothetical protein
MKRAEQLAEYLDNKARGEEDNEAAKLLRDLSKVYDIAREIVLARTHEHSRDAYHELVDLIKGKKGV